MTAPCAASTLSYLVQSHAQQWLVSNGQVLISPQKKEQSSRTSPLKVVSKLTRRKYPSVIAFTESRSRRQQTDKWRHVAT